MQTCVFDVKSVFTIFSYSTGFTMYRKRQTTVTDRRHHGLTERLPYIDLLSVQRQILQAVAWNRGMGSPVSVGVAEIFFFIQPWRNGPPVLVNKRYRFGYVTLPTLLTKDEIVVF